MFFLDLLFPKTCVACGFWGTYLCDNCRKQLIAAEDHCPYCYKKSYLGLTHVGCQRRLGLDGLTSLYIYNNTLKKIIKSIKYRLATEVWQELKKIFLFEAQNKWKEHAKVFSSSYLQTIPLHPKKLRQRGFNQVDFMADIAKRAFSASSITLLVRKKQTLAQAEQASKEKRYQNMRGAFNFCRAKQAINDVVIIDDVTTSGSTIFEACRVLKKNGIRKVYGLTLARG